MGTLSIHTVIQNNMSTSIPRFLLPQRGAIWRSRLTIPSSSTALAIRHASKVPKKTTKPSKPLVLEKPAKFVPPSHGSRLRKDPPRYPGPQLSAEEAAQQQTKKYPNLMPPQGTFMHWFINNRSIHIYITMVFLASSFLRLKLISLRAHCSLSQERCLSQISRTIPHLRICYHTGRNYSQVQLHSSGPGPKC